MKKDAESNIETGCEIDTMYYFEKYQEYELNVAEIENLFETLYLAMESTVFYDPEYSFLINLANVIREKFKNLPS